MSSANRSIVTRKSGTFFERYGWIVFVVLGVIITLFGLGDIVSGGSTFEGGEAPTIQGISGMTWQELNSASPGAASMIDYLVRAGGVHLVVFGLLSTVVAVTAFRRGERWAWYAMWVWALWIAMLELVLLNAYKQAGPGIPPPLISGFIFLALAVLTLLLSYRKFFPRQQPIRAANEAT